MSIRVFVQKESMKFSASHMTLFPNGKKERIHGHNFQVGISIEFRKFDEENFLDFSVIKKTIYQILSVLDEKLLLPEKSKRLKVKSKKAKSVEFTIDRDFYVIPKNEIVFLPLKNIMTETLAEYLLHEFVKKMKKTKPFSAVSKVSMQIKETAGQGAEAVVDL